MTASGGPYFDELEIGQAFDTAPSMTLTSGVAAARRAILGDWLRLALDTELTAAVTGVPALLAHPGGGLPPLPGHRWGITSATAHTLLGKVGKFADVIKIRTGLGEVVGLARTIAFTGTDAQKDKLAEVRSNLLGAITEANRTLHGALAEG